MKKIIKNLLYRLFKRKAFLNALKKKQNKNIIICLHKVIKNEDFNKIDSSKRDFCVTDIFLENLIVNLKKEFKFVKLEELISDKSNERLCHITFDDGYKDNIKNGLPIFEKYLIPFTIFVCDSYLDGKINNNKLLCAEHKREFMRWNDLLNILDNKLIEIGCHTKNHHILTQLNEKELANEIINSKLSIEHRINKEVRFFAYPYGARDKYSEEIIKIVRKANFVAAFTTDCIDDINIDQYNYPRYFVTEKCNMNHLNIRFSGLCNLFRNQMLPS